MPPVSALQEAVAAVIESNREDGYIPGRIIQITQNGDVPNLKSICEELVGSGIQPDELVHAFPVRRLKVLTLEDYIVPYGRDWGISEDVIQVASDMMTTFDLLAGGPRYTDEA